MCLEFSLAMISITLYNGGPIVLFGYHDFADLFGGSHVVNNININLIFIISLPEMVLYFRN